MGTVESHQPELDDLQKRLTSVDDTYAELWRVFGEAQKKTVLLKKVLQSTTVDEILEPDGKELWTSVTQQMSQYMSDIENILLEQKLITTNELRELFVYLQIFTEKYFEADFTTLFRILASETSADITKQPEKSLELLQDYDISSKYTNLTLLQTESEKILRNQNKILQAAEKTLRQNLSENTQSMEQLLIELQMEKTKNKNSEQQAAVLQEKADSLEVQLKETRENIRKHSEKTDAIQAECSALKDNLAKTKKDYAHTRKQLDDETRKLTACELQLKDYKHESCRLNTENSNLYAEAKKVEEGLLRAENEVDEWKKMYSNVIEEKYSLIGNELKQINLAVLDNTQSTEQLRQDIRSICMLKEDLEKEMEKLKRQNENDRSRAQESLLSAKEECQQIKLEVKKLHTETHQSNIEHQKNQTNLKEKINKLKEKIRSLENENLQKDLTIEKLKKDINTYKEESLAFVKCEKELTKVEQELIATKKENEEKEIKRNELEEKMRKLLQEKTILDKEVKQSKEENMRLETYLQTEKSKVDQVLSNNKDLALSAQSCKAEITENKIKVQEYKKRVEELQRQNENIIASNSYVEKTVAGLKWAIEESVKQTNREINRDKAETVSKITSKLNELDITVQHMDTTLKDKITESEVSKKKIKDLEETYLKEKRSRIAAESQISKLENELKEKKVEIKQFEEEVCKNKKTISELNVTKDQLKEKSRVLLKETDDQKQMIDELKSENSALTLNVSTLEKQVSKTESKIVLCEKEICCLKELNVQEKDCRKKAELTAIEIKEKAAEELDKKCKELRHSKARIEQLEVEKTQYEISKDEMILKIDELKSDILQYKDDAETLKKTTAQLEEKLSKEIEANKYLGDISSKQEMSLKETHIKMKKEKDRADAEKKRLMEEIKTKEETLKMMRTSLEQTHKSEMEKKRESEEYKEQVKLLEKKNREAQQRIVDLDKKLRDEICFYERLTSKEKLQVQLYSTQRGELVADVETKLMQTLKEKLETEQLQVEFIQCARQEEIKPDIPVLLLCTTASRLGVDVTNSLQGLTPTTKMALLIFHHKDLHALPSQASERVLSISALGHLGAVFDMAFLTGKGIYSCPMNNNGLVSIVNFIAKEGNKVPLYKV